MSFDRQSLIRRETETLLYTRPRDPRVRPTASLFLIDRSGSMQELGDAPMETARGYFNELRTSHNAHVIAAGIATFADDMSIDIPLQPVATVDLTTFSYIAAGNTLLFGSVANVLGSMIDLHQEILRRTQGALNLGVAISVVTDGYNTLNAEYLEQVRRLAPRALQRGFTLEIYGLGIDAKEQARTMGFPEEHAHNLRRVAQDMRATGTRSAQTAHHTTMSGGYTVPKP